MLTANTEILCDARMSDRCDDSIVITEVEVREAQEAFDAGHKYIMRRWALNCNTNAMCPKCLSMASLLWSEILDG